METLQDIIDEMKALKIAQTFRQHNMIPYKQCPDCMHRDCTLYKECILRIAADIRDCKETRTDFHMLRDWLVDLIF